MDLVQDEATRMPATQEADYVVTRYFFFFFKLPSRVETTMDASLQRLGVHPITTNLAK